MTTDERDAIRAEQNRPRVASIEANSLLRTSVVIDMTQPSTQENLTNGVLESARNAHFSLVSVTVAEDRTDVHGAMTGIGAVRRYAEQRPDDFTFVTEYADILAAHDAQRTAISVHFQETNQLEGHLDLLPLYRDLGVTHMLLAYNNRNMVADGCAEPTDGGLSRFGKAVVSAMREVGILCDGTHTGRRSTMEAMELYGGPFIFSHSNCQAVFDHYRNITDEQIRACAQTGGVIGVNGVGRFLDDPYARAESIFRHVDHIISLVGPQHVGIGLDRMTDPDRMFRWITENAMMWPNNSGRPIQYATFAPHAVTAEVVDLMISHGYPRETIEGWLGGNFLRVLRDVWAR